MTGAELKAHRLRLGLSRRALAERVGLNAYTVRYWERKPRVDLLGHAPGLLLIALWLGGVAAKARAERARRIGAFPNTLLRARGGVSLETDGYRRWRVTCGTKTRKGIPCRAKSELGKQRCRFHGGKSTGPKTPEGRARIAETQRRRWARWRRTRLTPSG